MPLDTTFSPAQVDVASGIRGLMNQYKAAQVQATRKDAMQGLMQGGDVKQSVAKLMGIGDVQGAQTLVNYYKAMNPTMSPYEVANLKLRGESDVRDRAKSFIDSIPNDLRTFYYTHPEQADPQFRQSLQVLQGGGQIQGENSDTTPVNQTVAPSVAPPTNPVAQTAQPTTSVQPQPGEGFDAWKQRVEVNKQKGIAQAKIEAKKPSYMEAVRKASAVGGTSKEALSVVDQILQYPDMVGETATGAVGKYAVGGSNQATLQGLIDGLKGQIGFSMYQSLRDASATGSAGIQRLTNAELFMLTNAIRSLDYEKMNWPTLKQNLVAIKQRLEGMQGELQAQLKEDYPDQYGTPEQSQPTQANLPETAPPSAGNVPIQGASQQTSNPNGPYVPPTQGSVQSKVDLARKALQNGHSFADVQKAMEQAGVPSNAIRSFFDEWMQSRNMQ